MSYFDIAARQKAFNDKLKTMMESRDGPTCYPPGFSITDVTDQPGALVPIGSGGPMVPFADPKSWQPEQQQIAFDGWQNPMVPFKFNKPKTKMAQPKVDGSLVPFVGTKKNIPMAKAPMELGYSAPDPNVLMPLPKPKKPAPALASDNYNYPMSLTNPGSPYQQEQFGFPLEKKNPSMMGQAAGGPGPAFTVGREGNPMFAKGGPGASYGHKGYPMFAKGGTGPSFGNKCYRVYANGGPGPSFSHKGYPVFAKGGPGQSFGQKGYPVFAKGGPGQSFGHDGYPVFAKGGPDPSFGHDGYPVVATEGKLAKPNAIKRVVPNVEGSTTPAKKPRAKKTPKVSEGVMVNTTINIQQGSGQGLYLTTDQLQQLIESNRGEPGKKRQMSPGENVDSPSKRKPAAKKATAKQSAALDPQTIEKEDPMSIKAPKAAPKAKAAKSKAPAACSISDPVPSTSKDTGAPKKSDAPKNPFRWTVSQVCDFVKNLPGCAAYTDIFRQNAIDGKALMLINYKHLIEEMGVKMGPALKLASKVEELNLEFSSKLPTNKKTTSKM